MSSSTPTASPTPMASSTDIKAPAGPLGGNKAVPYEDFEIDADCDEKKSDDRFRPFKRQMKSWISKVPLSSRFLKSRQPDGSSGPPPPSETYKILADSCGYKGKVSNMMEWAKIRRVKSNCQVYQDILEYVNNSRYAMLKVHQIYKVERKDERALFNQLRLMLWHGIPYNRVPEIIEKGFERKSDEPMINFADRIGKSQAHASPTRKGRNFFFLAEVAPGNTYKAYHPHDTRTCNKAPPEGYDSVKTVGSNIPSWDKNKTYNGAIMPCGPTVRNVKQSNYHYYYNDYLIYNHNRAIVKFIVECSY